MPIASSEFAREMAAKSNRSRRRKNTARDADQIIERLVDAAPLLSESQLAKLQSIFGGAK